MTQVSQEMFRDAMLNPSAPVPDGLTDGGVQPAGLRFNVYRNNVAVSLTEAMRTGFPIVAKLLGEQNMDGLSGLFLRAHPPSSPLMMHYGAAFPGFIESMEQLAKYPYLADIARLELALRQSYHAADSTPIDPQILGALSPDNLFAATVALAPSALVLRSRYPIHGIWRMNTEEGAPKPAPRAEDVLMARPEFDPIPFLLPQGGADWIEALADGASIGDAHEQASKTSPDFELGATLGIMLQGGVISSLSTKD